MFKIKSFLFAISLIAGLTIGIFAQSGDLRQTDKSYEILLQVLTTSQIASELPASLKNSTEKLRQIYPSLKFSLTETYIGKTSENGKISNRQVTTFPEQSKISADLPGFTEFGIDGIQTSGNKIRIARFNYGLRAPIKNGSNVNYEQLGLTVNNLILAENVPAIIGTLTANRPDEIIVLVLTIKEDIS